MELSSLHATVLAALAPSFRLFEVTFSEWANLAAKSCTLSEASPALVLTVFALLDLFQSF